jgi:hypothetical protein
MFATDGSAFSEFRILPTSPFKINSGTCLSFVPLNRFFFTEISSEFAGENLP